MPKRSNYKESKTLRRSGRNQTPIISKREDDAIEELDIFEEEKTDETTASKSCKSTRRNLKRKSLNDDAEQDTKKYKQQINVTAMSCSIPDDENNVPVGHLQSLLNQIRTPRSAENDKFKDVYATLPKMRCSSPPRFTTKGIKKKRLNAEELGVRIIGKAEGNPFSNYRKKRNGIIYGNQSFENLQEMEKYAKAAINIKQVLDKQSQNLRVSSYVQPTVLAEARKLQGRKSPVIPEVKEEDFEVDDDIDVETVEVTDASLKPEDAEVPATDKKRRRGRRPGRTALECKDCDYRTVHSGHMKVHVLCRHTDVKDLECKYPGCNYKCARKGSMTRHEKCVHRKDKLFQCDRCDFVSAWSMSLERHIVTRHEKLKPWTCELCSKSFGQQYTLTTHMNTIHKKVKRIKCGFCSFRAATRDAVKSHMVKMHAKEIEETVNEAQTKETASELDLHLNDEEISCNTSYADGVTDISHDRNEICANDTGLE